MQKESVQPFVVPIDLEGIPIEDIRTYLLQRGWASATEQRDPRVEFFVRQEPDAIVMLPISPRLSDFYPRLREAIERIAQVEERSAYHIALNFKQIFWRVDKHQWHAIVVHAVQGLMRQSEALDQRDRAFRERLADLLIEIDQRLTGTVMDLSLQGISQERSRQKSSRKKQQRGQQ
jgi:hypothetical protein